MLVVKVKKIKKGNKNGKKEGSDIRKKDLGKVMCFDVIR